MVTDATASGAKLHLGSLPQLASSFKTRNQFERKINIVLVG
jgi:hypothetical protein